MDLELHLSWLLYVQFKFTFIYPDKSVGMSISVMSVLYAV